ncbi:MAG: inositol monophosphatase [Alphaproteobacteria bacterium]|nr:inositol monophosphatase [Alphaproteobacteria bacterium]
MRHALAVAVDAARRAGALLLAARDRGVRVRDKGARDLVTEADEASQACIVEVLQAAFPHHAVLGEEGLSTAGDGSGLRWVVDPLDGTTNFVHGLPHFAVSIGLEVDDTPVLGVVYDPCKDELFTAIVGLGAWVGDRSLRVSSAATLDTALVCTGFPTDPAARAVAFARAARVLQAARGLRRTGSAALDLAYVAAGRFDLFFEPSGGSGLGPWDVVAGIALVQAAGGRVSDAHGAAFRQGATLVASNGAVHPAALDLLAVDA